MKQIKSKSHARRLALEQIKILVRGLYVIMKVVSYIKPKIRKKEDWENARDQTEKPSHLESAPFQSCPPKGQMVSPCISTASRKIFNGFFVFVFVCFFLLLLLFCFVFFSLKLSLEKLIFLLFREITCPRKFSKN